MQTRRVYILSLVALIATGCGSMKEHVRYYASAEIKSAPSPRSEPAKLTGESERSLERQGLLKLGRLEVNREGSSKDSLVPKLLKEAAKIGGDVVYIEKRDVAESFGVPETYCEHEVARKVSQRVETKVPKYDSKGNVSYYETRYNTVTDTVRECDRWGQRVKTVQGLATHASVWRYR